MARLADPIRIVLVAGDARLQVAECFQAMAPAVYAVGPARRVGMGQDLIIPMAVDAKLRVGVATRARFLVGLRFQGVRKFKVERMREAIQVVALVAVLAEIVVVARQAGLLGVDGHGGLAGQVRMGVREARRVAQRRQPIFGQVADGAFLGGPPVLMARHTFDHRR